MICLASKLLFNIQFADKYLSSFVGTMSNFELYFVARSFRKVVIFVQKKKRRKSLKKNMFLKTIQRINGLFRK